MNANQVQFSSFVSLTFLQCIKSIMWYYLQRISKFSVHICKTGIVWQFGYPSTHPIIWHHTSKASVVSQFTKVNYINFWYIHAKQAQFCSFNNPHLLPKFGCTHQKQVQFRSLGSKIFKIFTMSILIKSSFVVLSL